MPFGSVTLIPGVNVEKTPSLNEASISQSQLIRFKDGLVQKYGGWNKFYQFSVTNTVRDLHGWTDARPNGSSYLAIAATNALQLLTVSSGSLSNITPQTLTSDFSPNFTTTASSPIVEILDTNIANVTTFDAVYIKTPIAIDGLVIWGLYPIASITGTSKYTIVANTNAISGVSNSGTVPLFTTTANSSTIEVTIDAHNVTANDTVVFETSTTGNGVTISGGYTVTEIVDANNFNIVTAAQANASSSFSMNSGNAEIVYYLNIGPPLAAQGYGIGNYGDGLYGFGTAGGSAQTGTPITATDWTTDNWGALLAACPSGGGVYFYDPAGGFSNAGLVARAPPYNSGLFISTSQQVLICWGSTVNEAIGAAQDDMLVSWSTVGDYTVFTPLTTNQAGSFRIPVGSMIMGGMAVQNQNLIWTDLDLWAMNYQGPPFVYGFNKIGAGAGMISSHAAQQLRDGVYWMGQRNFYVYRGGGVAVIPCAVWDAVFQNLNLDFVHNVRSMPNTPFNEVGWLYPSLASTSGECDSYVKFNITEPNAPWDYGLIDRTAWIDQGALGMPISATSTGLIYQQETTNDADGAALNASFTTGYFLLGEGEDFAYVDQILPDMKWGLYPGTGSAQILFTFNVIDWTSDTPRTYGPYSVTQTTPYITVRFRGRQMSITMQSLDTGSFWRIGRVRYRFSSDGRR